MPDDLGVPGYPRPPHLLCYYAVARRKTALDSILRPNAFRPEYSYGVWLSDQATATPSTISTEQTPAFERQAGWPFTVSIVRTATMVTLTDTDAPVPGVDACAAVGIARTASAANAARFMAASSAADTGARFHGAHPAQPTAGLRGSSLCGRRRRLPARLRTLGNLPGLESHRVSACSGRLYRSLDRAARHAVLLPDLGVAEASLPRRLDVSQMRLDGLQLGQVRCCDTCIMPREARPPRVQTEAPGCRLIRQPPGDRAAQFRLWPAVGTGSKTSAIAVAAFLAMPSSLTMREMTRPPPWTWNVVALPS